MEDRRMGLGTDQLEVSRQLAEQMPQLPQVPPMQRSAARATAAAGPDEASRPGLAQWAQQMQLPGVDT